MLQKQGMEWKRPWKMTWMLGLHGVYRDRPKREKEGSERLGFSIERVCSMLAWKVGTAAAPALGVPLEQCKF